MSLIATSNKKLLGGGHSYQGGGHYKQQETTSSSWPYYAFGRYVRGWHRDSNGAFLVTGSFLRQGSPLFHETFLRHATVLLQPKNACCQDDAGHRDVMRVLSMCSPPNRFLRHRSERETRQSRPETVLTGETPDFDELMTEMDTNKARAASVGRK